MSPFFQAAKKRIGLLIMLMSILIVAGGYALKSRWSKNGSEKLEQNSGKSNGQGEIETKSQLAMKLHQQCRFAEARTEAREAIRLGASHIELVLIACNVQVPLKTNSSVEEGSRLLVDARKLMLTGKDRFALDLLRKAISLDPNLYQAQGWYGQILAQNHSPEFATWNAALPMNAENHAAILFARGLALEENGQQDDAIKFYLAVLHRNLFHAQVAARLENLLKQDQKRYEIHANDLKSLKRLNRLAEDLVHAPDFEVMRRLHEILYDLGDYELANGLARSALNLGCAEDWAKQILSRQADAPLRFLSRISNRHSSLTISEEDTDWETFQFFDSQQPSRSVETQDIFIDIASEMGIEFRYENGSDPQFPLGHLFESTGGGVAVLDYDLDGWPDLYFAQGGDWREKPQTGILSDQIYRNRSGSAARNVTQHVNIAEFKFSQGVTVGDFNSDGFPDLYLCNLGENRLFENQGDGTFLDVSQISNTQGDDWSISAAFADFNNDGLADLYVVNYLEMETVRNSPCFFQGKMRACPPTKFRGTLDAVYFNLGNGEFRQLNPHRDESDFPGKGMGLIVADLTGDGELNVFVGNDGQENDHYQVTTLNKSSLPIFEENAIPLGIATNREGVKQATMGIASGDANNDGRVDLFTTNFYGETNTLFINHASSHFEDRTRSYGDLESSSLSMLGFGTQFIDVELDGDFDLFVANGHIDRMSVTGEPDVMLPQFFQNKGQGEFLAKGFVAPNSYFETPALGRAVATLDWNRDGRSDLAVTHLDRSAALLLNHYPNPGSSVTFQLTGTISERDAIGAVVTLESGAQVWQQQVVAGNGYEASNEKCLIFGLGERELIDQIRVNWPNGTTEVYLEVKTGRKYRIIEEQGLYAVP